MCNLILSMMVVGAVQTGPNELTVQIMTANKDIHTCMVIPAPQKVSEAVEAP